MAKEAEEKKKRKMPSSGFFEALADVFDAVSEMSSAASDLSNAIGNACEEYEKMKTA